MGHWPIVVALEFYLAASSILSKGRLAGAVAICALSAAINPYIALLTLLLIGAGCLKALLIRPTGFIAPLTTAALSGVACVLTLFVFGFLGSGDIKSYAGNGYTLYSMNALAPIDPQIYKSLFLKQQPSLGGQYEGYNYLGVGVILLLVVSIARAPAVFCRKLADRSAWPALCVAAISTVLALSIKATFGTYIIYNVAVPDLIFNMLSVYRASGRLFWLAYYLILGGAIGASALAFRKYLPALLIVAFLIQYEDLNGLFNAVRATWDASSSAQITDGPVWQQIASEYHKLVVTPAWQCGASDTPAGEDGFWTFGKLAAAHKMNINSFYAGRNSPTQLTYFCHTQPEEIKASGLKQDTAYVFSKAADVVSINPSDVFCRRQDGVILCTKEANRKGIDAAIYSMLPLIDTDHPFNSVDKAMSSQIFSTGWSSTGSPKWTTDTDATVALLVPASHTLDLVIQPFSPNGYYQRLSILSGSVKLGEWSLPQKSDISFHVPPEAIGAQGSLVLTLRMPDAASPKSLGVNEDTRRLGVAILDIRPH